MQVVAPAVWLLCKVGVLVETSVFYVYVYASCCTCSVIILCKVGVLRETSVFYVYVYASCCTCSLVFSSLIQAIGFNRSPCCLNQINKRKTNDLSARWGPSQHQKAAHYRRFEVSRVSRPYLDRLWWQQSIISIYNTYSFYTN